MSAASGFFYEGPPLESGGTSIRGRAAPFVRELVSWYEPGIVTLDYGAGRHARNADFLRRQGFETFAFDPFHSTGGSGWEIGSVVSDPDLIPAGSFDVAMSVYVLNVVPRYAEDQILEALEELAPGAHQFHVVRNRDILDMVRNAARRLAQSSGARSPSDQRLADFVAEDFLPACHAESGGLVNWADLASDPEALRELCEFGVPTGAGFQRLVHLEDRGFELIEKKSGYKGYERTAARSW